MLRAGSSSIDIPHRNLRRAGTAPAMTDDIIAAAVAAASASSGSPSKAPPSGAPGGAALPPSSASNSCRSSPPSGAGTGRASTSSTLPPESQASCTRELFEAQAEAVAAQAQAKVLQQALAREQERVAQLQSQLRALLRDRAEDRARLQELEAAHKQQPRSQRQRQQGTASLPSPVAVHALAAQARPAAPVDLGVQRQRPAGFPELAAALAALNP
ncbi:hypothetical protein ABPG77_009946 [Micractinium sp. CCAP 211/92]